MADRTPIGVDDIELDDLALEALATAYATAPPPALRERVLAAAHVAGAQPARPATRWRLVGAVAAGVALVAGGLLARATRLAELRGAELAGLARTNAELLARVDAQERTLAGLREAVAAQATVLRVLGGPHVQTATLAPQGGVRARGRVLLDATTGDAAVVISDLDPAAAGKTYELWAIRGDRPPEPAGLFGAGPDRVATAPAQRIERPAEVTAFAVSIEPAGGSAKPTGPIVLMGPLTG
jgi:anti-sigma-K factor RskA